MKKWKFLPLLLAALILAGCSSAGTPAPAPQSPPPAPAVSEATPAADTAPAAAATPEASEATAALTPVTPEGPLAMYRPVLKAYAMALEEKWTAQEYLRRDLSTQVPNFLGDNAADCLAYSLLDLDGDGTPELLIGDHAQGMVMDCYRLVDGAPSRVFVSVNRVGTEDESEEEPLWDCWYLCREEGGSYFLNYEVQKNWLFCGYFRASVEAGTPVVEEGYLYDSGTDEFNPWYRVDGYTLEHNPEQSVTMEEGDMATYEYEAARVTLDSLDSTCLFADFQ